MFTKNTFYVPAVYILYDYRNCRHYYVTTSLFFYSWNTAVFFYDSGGFSSICYGAVP